MRYCDYYFQDRLWDEFDDEVRSRLEEAQIVYRREGILGKAMLEANVEVIINSPSEYGKDKSGEEERTEGEREDLARVNNDRASDQRELEQPGVQEVVQRRELEVRAPGTTVIFQRIELTTVHVVRGDQRDSGSLLSEQATEGREEVHHGETLALEERCNPQDSRSSGDHGQHEDSTHLTLDPEQSHVRI